MMDPGKEEIFPDTSDFNINRFSRVAMFQKDYRRGDFPRIYTYTMGMKALLLIPLAALLAACAGSMQGLTPACRTMEAQLQEKKELDAKIKTTMNEVRDYRKRGDTASAASAEHRLEGMLQSQRLLKESLDQSSRDCSPAMQDPMPVRDPATRDNLPK
jgi:type II secretory pathway component PulM